MTGKTHLSIAIGLRACLAGLGPLHEFLDKKLAWMNRTQRLKSPPPDGRLAEMNSEEAMDDLSMLLIAKKAGYGLARPKWHATLEEIRRLPEVQVRPAT